MSSAGIAAMVSLIDLSLFYFNIVFFTQFLFSGLFTDNFSVNFSDYALHLVEFIPSINYFLFYMSSKLVRYIIKHIKCIDDIIAINDIIRVIVFLNPLLSCD